MVFFNVTEILIVWNVEGRKFLQFSYFLQPRVNKLSFSGCANEEIKLEIGILYLLVYLISLKEQKLLC